MQPTAESALVWMSLKDGGVYVPNHFWPTHPWSVYLPLSTYVSFCWNSEWNESRSRRWPVWPDWAIYWTLGNYLKPLATIILPKSPTLLGNFCKGVKIIHFLVNSFWAIFIHIWRFLSDHTAGSSLSISGSPCWTLKQHVLWQNILRGHIPSKMEGQPFQFVDL